MLYSLIFHVWRDFPSVKVWFWKTKLWLMFLSTHSFQNLSPSRALVFNLMGSLMPIFKKIHPISGVCSPLWSSAAPNFASSQNICCSVSGSFCWEFCVIAFDYGLVTSATWRSIYILPDPCPLSPSSLGPSNYLIVIFIHPSLVYLNLISLT